MEAFHYGNHQYTKKASRRGGRREKVNYKIARKQQDNTNKFLHFNNYSK